MATAARTRCPARSGSTRREPEKPQNDRSAAWGHTIANRSNPMTLLVVSVITVLIVSALCSLTEAAIYAVRMPYISGLAETGSLAGKVRTSAPSASASSRWSGCHVSYAARCAAGGVMRTTTSMGSPLSMMP